MMNRHRVVWSNFPGAPGYSNFFTGTGVTDSTPFKTFFSTAIGSGATSILPNGTVLTFPSSGDQVEEATGQIVGTWTGTAPTTLVSSATATSYAGMAGAQCQWLTSLIVSGRRVRGATFLVPLLNQAFDSNGSLSTGTVGNIQSAATALIAALAGELKIWSRPRPTIAGANATVIAARCPDLAVSLRSRRT